jgi:hypothetical protein
MKKARFSVVLAGILFASNVFAQVIVKLEGKGKCSEKAEMVVAREKSFLFHIQLPAGGNAEFKLVPGKYEFHAMTKSKCLGRQEFTVEEKPLKAQIITVTLVHESKRKPAADNISSGCTCCGVGSPCGIEIPFQAPFMMPWYHSMYYPWYRNWSNPCAFQGYGCTTNFMPPGNGPVFMGKPNIYFEGITKNLKIKFPDVVMKGMLATAPAYLDKGWEIKTDGRMVIHKRVKYPYLYYDLRTTADGLQFTNGFCGERTELLNKMLDGLKKLSFPDRSIEDFKEHWGTHFPQGREYCILPQTTTELEKSAPIEFSVPTSFTRLVYMVLPAKVLADEPMLDPAFNDFKPLTLKNWDPWAIKPAKDKVRAYEWGLAFTFSK